MDEIKNIALGNLIAAPDNPFKVTMDTEMKYADRTPSLSHPIRLYNFSREGRLNSAIIYAVLSGKKSNQKK